MNIPNGHQAVMPYLILDGARRFMDFVSAVFDAQIVNKHSENGEEGRIIHAEAVINGSTVMFADATTQWKSHAGSMFTYVDDADVYFKKALDAGGKVIMELSDQDYGRTCGVADPTGNIWWITTPKK